MKKGLTGIMLFVMTGLYILMAPKFLSADKTTEDDVRTTKGNSQPIMDIAADYVLEAAKISQLQDFSILRDSEFADSSIEKVQEAFQPIGEMEVKFELPYTDEDLYWLSRVIHAEAGSSWIPDWVQQAVGSVVLNRVKDTRYSDTIEKVIFDKGQYHCVVNESIYQEPSKKAIRNAKYILENGSTLPNGVVGQSEFVQGEIYEEYYDKYLGTTTYFCYID